MDAVEVRKGMQQMRLQDLSTTIGVFFVTNWNRMLLTLCMLDVMSCLGLRKGSSVGVKGAKYSFCPVVMAL